jgi:hypothetical protein
MSGLRSTMEKQITIAADSKQTLVQGQSVVGLQTVCKVYEVRNIVVALARLAAEEGVGVVDAINRSRERELVLNS